MTRDPIVQEVWRVRQELFAEHGNDLATLVRALQRRQRACGRRLISLHRASKKVSR